MSKSGADVSERTVAVAARTVYCLNRQQQALPEALPFLNSVPAAFKLPMAICFVRLQSVVTANSHSQSIYRK